MNIEVVSASRLTEDEFWERSALGLSLAALVRENRIVTRIRCENREALPRLYNRAIDAEDESDVLVFVHDDVWLHDWHWVDRVLEGLQHYDVLGLAGSRQRTPQQIAWFSQGPTLHPNLSALSGLVGRGQTPLEMTPAAFGPAPAECELLDGFFLAARKATLRQHGVRFDPQFDFHFYDMDFCRSARAAGLRLGTWRISLTHQSTGNFTSSGWQAMAQRYLAKWPD